MRPAARTPSARNTAPSVPVDRTMSRLPRLLLLPLALVALSALAWAVAGDTYYFEAAHDGETELEADLDLALGHIRLRRNDGPALFEAEVRLKEDDVRPRFDFQSDGRRGRVSLGLDGEGKGSGFTLTGLNVPKENAWEVFLSDDVALDLQLEVGMAKADFDLTGLQLRRLAMDCGMSEATLRIDRPSPVIAEEIQIDAGMARFDALRLGNARFRSFRFEGGAGEFSLDFTGGPLPAGAEADVEVGMASLRVTVPADRPVVLRAPESWLARVVVPDGYTKRGDGEWHSPAVRNPDQAFSLDIEAAAGKVIVVAR